MPLNLAVPLVPSAPPAPPTTIEEVIAQENDIIDQSLRTPGRIGYFTALYERVTVDVRRAIIAGNVFQDNARMEKLDVVFASRFLAAWNAYTSGGTPTQSWQLAFDALKDDSPLILQHLLLGMNAHINLDLGIAAATVAPGHELASLREDFNRINALLSRLVAVVEVELGEVSPRLKRLEAISPEGEDKIFNFAMDAAREAAWLLAEQLAPLPQEQWAPHIAAYDQIVAGLGKLILHPGLLVDGLLTWIREAESKDIAYNIQVIGG
ncbi:hypothetical protein D7Y27_03680 [Corallococcus sp. AB004]|uniref:DUF5995 family protein n=1 Tax=Corallococcus exiguus TaxID=83462 RepID=UPI000EA0CB51|nr:DUF5995 family protein [Corallococcus exiguus]NPC69006.1 hypothetical protein [Corallococcus exiguus]NPD22947.1 hypothetical protein [Corallococcus exiguus]NRD42983.1 hypothetical protein [Corallococcus exiguus]RKI49355.1 hypothetical protein D7Y27_03680 [Corallococcus sp. AB004]